MILKASQRGGAKQLAFHLMRTDENEHVELHEVRGFLTEDLREAFDEAYAISQGTKCKQFLFSLSLSPPQNESVPIEIFEGAIEDIEQKLGLADQPRAIVFHEKEGRRHAHCVWSRIDAEEMKAINIAHYKLKLRDVSRELYLENGWQMPRGLVNSQERDPANFSREEWQQAKRAGHDAKALKSLFQECWAISDSKAAFASALEERGYHLARGDRRGFVAVDHQGEIYAIARWTGLRANDVKARLGDPQQLPSVVETKAKIAKRMTTALRNHVEAAKQDRRAAAAGLAQIKRRMTERHRQERSILRDKQSARWQAETIERSKRLPRGLKGLWSRLTGKYGKVRAQNEREASAGLVRDRSEQQALIDRQMEDRRILQRQIRQVRRSTSAEITELNRDVAQYLRMEADALPPLKQRFQDASGGRPAPEPRRRRRGKDRGPEI